MNLIDLISKHPVPVTRFQRPYVIAEAGVNHEGSMDIARRLIDEAALGGADAIKFQTYKAGTLAKGNPLALLHCVLNYPTMDENAALGMIPALVRHFPQHVIGYSDHTLPNDMKVLEVAALLGAQILEKHFSHDKTLPGNDHYHAMDYKDLQLFRQNFERTLSMIGEMRIEALASEEPARQNARRSLVANRNIPAGKIIDKDDLTWKRPAGGISPRHYYEVLGMAARADIEEDTVLQWAHLE